MRTATFARTLLALGFVLASAACGAQPADPFTHLFDTKTPSAKPISGGALIAASGWAVVPEEAAAYAFTGDAVAKNDRIAIAARRGAAGAEVYGLNAAGARLQAVLRPAAGAAINAVSVHQNAQELVSIDVSFGGALKQGLRLEIVLGQIFVKAQALDETKALTVSAPCEYAVMPDFFADDIVIAAADLPAGVAEIPSENFLLHLRDGGNAIVAAVWENRNQDVRVETVEQDGRKLIQATEITFGKEGNVWIAVLAREQVWHAQTVAREQAGQILPLEWAQPYPAVWRVDWRRADALTDSWEMAIENPDGSLRKSDLFEASRDDWTDEDWWSDENPRRRWNTVLGGYIYPCWIDKEGKGFLQPLGGKQGRRREYPNKHWPVFDGPAVLYPINRSAQTPLEEFTVTDVVRATLGVGPCQYILDLEGQDLAFQGRPTCDVRNTLNAIYEGGEQITRKEEVAQALENVIAFIKMIRGRIDQYQAFAGEMAQYLQAEQPQHAEIVPFVEEMLVLNAKIIEAFEARKEGLKSPEYAVSLAEKFRASVAGYEGADALDKCKEITAGWVGIGDNQDELVGECRLAVKILRQRAAIAMAQDPRTTEMVKLIRERTQAVLRDPVNYEAARH